MANATEERKGKGPRLRKQMMAKEESRGHSGGTFRSFQGPMQTGAQKKTRGDRKSTKRRPGGGKSSPIMHICGVPAVRRIACLWLV